MAIRRPHRRLHRRPARFALFRVALAGGLAGGMAFFPSSPAVPQEAGTAYSGVSLFDARAVGSIVNFSFHIPEAFFPFEITGGMLESTGRATSLPQAFGTAGLAPVPLATSIGLIIPKVVPGTDIPVPEDVQEAFKSVDFTALPNGCQASYPPVEEGQDEATCGGPYQSDSALGFTAAGLNGHVQAYGTFDDRFATRTVSVSRGGDVTVPGLQAEFHQAYSRSVTGRNDNGLPEGRAVAEIDSFSILGELLRVEGARSETVVATDGTPEGAVVSSSLTIRAASVLGIPVVIGPDGVSVNREAVPATELRTLTTLVEEALDQAGSMKIRLVPAPPVQVRGGEVTAGSGAIEISYLAQEPTPANVVQRVAYTRARVNAVPESAGPEVVEGSPPSLGVGPANDGQTHSGAGAEATPVQGPSLESPSVALSPEVGPGAFEPILPQPAARTTSRVSEGSEIAAEYPQEAARDELEGAAASSGRAVGRQAAAAGPASGFDLAARTRLKALYGGVVAVSLLGVMLLPLLRATYRRLTAPAG